jgi:Flp pilus assembly protein TadG
VVVEFAVVAPVLLTLMLGLIYASQLYQMSITLHNAARQGARLAGVDREDILLDGQSTNEKITQDIKHFLTASGCNGEAATVTITNPETGAEINLDDPINNFELFEITIDVPLDLWGHGGDSGGESCSMTRNYFFRNTRAPVLFD